MSSTALIDKVFFVSAGENTTRAGLVRLTGSNGPGTVSTTPASTVIVKETVTTVQETITAAASPGVIAGSVVGGAALGALLTLLVFVLLWLGRQKKASGQGMGQDGDAAAAATYTPASQMPGAASAGAQSPYATGWAWGASNQHELHGFSGPAEPETQELSGKPHS